MHTKTSILNLLTTNDKAIARALVALNTYQTRSEKQDMATEERNGMGFTPTDAYMGTSMAEFYSKNWVLTAKQLAYWKQPNAKGIPRIGKYAAQLARIANRRNQSESV